VPSVANLAEVRVVAVENQAERVKLIISEVEENQNLKRVPRNLELKKIPIPSPAGQAVQKPQMMVSSEIANLALAAPLIQAMMVSSEIANLVLEILGKALVKVSLPEIVLGLMTAESSAKSVGKASLGVLVTKNLRVLHRKSREIFLSENLRMVEIINLNQDLNCLMAFF
jgi:hypothetical protein